MGRLAGFSYRQIVKIIKSFGFVFYRQAAGSHEIWFNFETNLYTTIPNHSGDMPEGTLRAILKQAGIVQHPQWYKRPDWFGVVGVPKLYEERDLRLSYVIWQERANPFVVVELLSPGTEAEDLGETESKLNKGLPNEKFMNGFCEFPTILSLVATQKKSKHFT